MIEATEFQNDVRTDIYTESDGIGGSKVVIKESQDVEPFLDANKVDMGDAPTWRPYSNHDFYHVARIPNILVAKWMREGFNIFDPSPDTAKELQRRLNSPEYAYLRRYPGRI